MASMAEINAKIAGLKQSQAYEKTFDFTRSFVAKAGTAGEFAVPITNEGPFLEESYNIRYTENSVVEDAGGNTKQVCVDLRARPITPRCLTTISRSSLSRRRALTTEPVTVRVRSIIFTPRATF